MKDDNAANSLQRSLADAIIKMQSLDEIRILLACGAKVNDPVTQGLRPLHYAVWQKYTQAVNLLLVRGANINLTDECGYSALHLAAEHGYLELTELLLNAGAKVDYRHATDELYPRTTHCDEPLRLALRNKHYKVARLLLEHGADPNKRYFFGGEINLVSDVEALELLLTFGAHTEIRDRSGMTPLMKASRHNQDMEGILLLLSHGAEVNAMSDIRNDFRTPLHYAVLSGNIILVNLLLKQGAKIDLVPPLPETDKPSPLHLAILRGDPAIVRILLENGANVNRCSPVIGSPLHVACADHIQHRMEIMKLLMSYGANPNIRIVAESDTNAILRPALAELLASNENVGLKELHLLLKYGARVIMKTQFRDPDGLLNCLEHVPANTPQFRILIESAESFDLCMIRRCQNLKNDQREKLMEKATRPLSLQFHCRTAIRKALGIESPYQVPSFCIPDVLKKYLLYEYT